MGAPVTTDQTVLSLSLSLFVVHSSTCHLGCYIEISTERSDIYSASKMGEQTLDVCILNVSSITGQDRLFALTIDRNYYANRFSDTCFDLSIHSCIQGVPKRSHSILDNVIRL